MFCWFILQISDIGIALTTTSHQQPEVTPVIRSRVTNLTIQEAVTRKPNSKLYGALGN
jgi:hypothetical protein